MPIKNVFKMLLPSEIFDTVFLGGEGGSKNLP